MFNNKALLDKAIKKDIAIAELEYLGLSLRIINSLEESKYKIIYLKDLLSLKEKDLKDIDNLGSTGLKQIYKVLEKIDSLEDEKNRWNRVFG